MHKTITTGCFFLLQVAGAVKFHDQVTSTRYFDKQEPSALYYSTDECLRTEEQWTAFDHLSQQIKQRYPSENLIQHLVNFCTSPGTSKAVKLCALVAVDDFKQPEPQPILRRESNYPKHPKDDLQMLPSNTISQMRHRSDLAFYLRQVLGCSRYGQREITAAEKKEIRYEGEYYLKLCIEHKELNLSKCNPELMEKVREFIIRDIFTPLTI